MRLLDTPQWDALSNAEKAHVNAVYGNGDELTMNYSPGAQKVINGLADKGLVTVEWGDERTKRQRQGTVRLREAGWV